ncbi:MAG: hypothetical protein ACK40L_10120 [Hydrogenophaga sp.]
MRQLVIAIGSLALWWAAGAAFAQDTATCVASADSRKLSGAARTSFLGKCERDATATCEAQATERKLHGAAKTSFTRKCVKDAVNGS